MSVQCSGMKMGKLWNTKDSPVSSPAYQSVSGELRLKRDTQGNYVFCEVERNKQGKIVRTPDGVPVFKQPLLKQGRLAIAFLFN
ncbi:hypothetical protein [Coleofasciculus sp. FACHB-129]|uniref:hypothetical protein n=1 Tax=Cyanophyceae TaxID=3028117 RepID=UPI0019C433A6|nr:hypothetical protein [Coleofasciculus sp. FACHB-129]MBD1895740.1 hypothetical protein [Coleofasciculus sp. FACHB-129]